MKQNHENVERAESELNTLHEDMEQTLELQRRLAQRATALEKEKKDLEVALQRRVLDFENERISMQTRIQSMGEDLRAKTEAQEKVNQLQAELLSTLDVKVKLEERLENFAKETAFLKKKADDYSNELRNLIIKEQFDQKLDRMGRKSVVRRAFIHFQMGVRDQCVDTANAEKAIRLYRLHCCKRLFLKLRLGAYRASAIRKAADKHKQAAFIRVWKYWKLNLIVKHKGLESLKKQAVARATHALQAWVAYVIHIRLNPERNEAAVSHWNRKCLRSFWDRWSNTLRYWKLGAREENLLTGKANRHFTKTVMRHTFEAWQVWLRVYARPERVKFAAVQAHINRMTMKQYLSAWRCVIYVKWVRSMKLEEATKLSQVWCMKSTFYRWLEGIRAVKLHRTLLTQAIAFRLFKQGQSVFRRLRHFRQRSLHMRIYNKMAFRHYLHSLSIKSMQIWRENVNYIKAQQRATAEVNQALTRAAMVFWRDYHVYESIKKKKDYRAVIHMKRKQNKLVKKIFVMWWEQVAWKRKAVQLDNLLAVRRRRTLLIQSLHVWLHATIDGLLLANAKFHEDLLEAQAQFEEQKHQVTAVDVENLQLIDRLHTMSSEVAFFKTSISEKEKQEEDLHRALEDSTMLESSMRSEIEQQHVRCEGLESEIQILKKKLQMKNVEDTAGEIHHTLEIQNLEQALKELRIQLSDRTSQIESYEKALKETGERLEGASDESQEKLTSAFEIAGSLRKLLEDRESQFATFEGNCRRRELELSEVQRKLAVANCTLCETVEYRDARIQELETMLSTKQQEVQEVQQQLQRLELAMDSKESRVRKLEYEIKLMSEQTALKANTFVSSLYSWEATSQFQSDANAPLKGGCSTKQSMRQTYDEAKSVLQHSVLSSLDEGVPKLRRVRTSYACVTEPSATNFEDMPGEVPSRGLDVVAQEPTCTQIEPLPPQENSTPSLEMKTPVDASVGLGSCQPDLTMSVPSRPDERAVMDVGTDTRRQLGEDTFDHESRSVLLYQGQGTSQRDWETSIALVSTTRPTPILPSTGPTPPGYMAEPAYVLADGRDSQDHPLEGGGGAMIQSSGEGHHRMILDDDPNAVDSLHLEIQRLQSRIMSRLRDSAGDPEGSFNRSGSRATTQQPLPECGTSSGRTWDGR
ncbi:uncharacterized protein [Physcomitrium patens]|uniref:uncharacterized protein n=1 Tax=Physcomitrium patens TaxID=3218 RepID=UPI000D166192|nr:uncharacterized protein LOC112286555 [Physcomitrium patens]|eukprot:XP_024384287.1 uncharacterized protein LOC112286555 [Physcomitrella patens]